MMIFNNSVLIGDSKNLISKATGKDFNSSRFKVLIIRQLPYKKSLPASCFIACARHQQKNEQITYEWPPLICIFIIIVDHLTVHK